MPLFARSVGLTGTLLLTCMTPALAATSTVSSAMSSAMSATTRAFLANLVPNVDFLERSSRFALANSKNARLRAFALSEVREQTLAIDALYDWTQAAARPALSAKDGAAKGLSAKGVSEKDLTATTLPTKALDTTPTGSTAPGWPPTQMLAAKPGSAADARLPRGQEDLDSLEGLDGPAFDADYKSAQSDALAQVEADYRDYLAGGDDPSLLALAKRELPKVKTRRVGLTRL